MKSLIDSVMSAAEAEAQKKAPAAIRTLTAEDEELVDITLAVARGEVSAEALAIWLRQRSRYQER